MRIRSVAFPYNASYPGEALPVLSIEIRNAKGLPGVVLDRVMSNTRADASVLPSADCQLPQLTAAMGVQGSIGGVAGGFAATPGTQIRVQFDGQDSPGRLHADFTVSEYILGRDVLRRFDILFRGVASEVIVNP